MLGPYHRRLDWLIWFAAMTDEPRDPWLVHLVWKLLDGDRAIRALLAVDPFAGAPPRFVRIRRFVYQLQPYRTPQWWSRDHEELWLPPVSLTTPGLAESLAHYGNAVAERALTKSSLGPGGDESAPRHDVPRGPWHLAGALHGHARRVPAHLASMVPTAAGSAAVARVQAGSPGYSWLRRYAQTRRATVATRSGLSSVVSAAS